MKSEIIMPNNVIYLPSVQGAAAGSFHEQSNSPLLVRPFPHSCNINIQYHLNYSLPDIASDAIYNSH